MADLSDFNFWVNNPDFRLFKEEESARTPWCTVSEPLVQWGDSLLGRLAADPQPGKVGFAKWKMLDRYCRLYFRTTSEHRAETNLDNHPCIHQALLEIWQSLEDLELQAAIPELELPRVVALPSAEPGADAESEEAQEEISGILIGEDLTEP